MKSLSVENPTGLVLFFAVGIKFRDLWDVTLCGVVVTYQGGICFLRLQNLLHFTVSHVRKHLSEASVSYFNK